MNNLIIRTVLTFVLFSGLAVHAQTISFAARETKHAEKLLYPYAQGDNPAAARINQHIAEKLANYKILDVDNPNVLFNTRIHHFSVNADAPNFIALTIDYYPDHYNGNVGSMHLGFDPATGELIKEDQLFRADQFKGLKRHFWASVHQEKAELLALVQQLRLDQSGQERPLSKKYRLNRDDRPWLDQWFGILTDENFWSHTCINADQFNFVHRSFEFVCQQAMSFPTFWYRYPMDADEFSNLLTPYGHCVFSTTRQHCIPEEKHVAS